MQFVQGIRPAQGESGLNVARSISELPDEVLLRQFCAGDAEAFESLLSRYERPLFNFILRQVGERTRAEELLQDAFLRVIERATEFKGESKFSTWLYTIARNLCIDESRKMVFRRHKSLDASTPGQDGDGPSLLDRTAGSEAGADRASIARELQPRIAAAVEALPEDQREVFLMRELQQMPFKEIAIVVGVPENTVKSRMRYALERLQAALAEYADYVGELEE
jgi:RNA polymerase sigma-70 factor (ECF subfamily)